MSTIAAGVGTASLKPAGGPSLSKAIETAMAKAVADALADGVSIENHIELKARQLAARNRVRVEFGLSAL